MKKSLGITWKHKAQSCQKTQTSADIRAGFGSDLGYLLCLGSRHIEINETEPPTDLQLLLGGHVQLIEACKLGGSPSPQIIVHTLVPPIGRLSGPLTLSHSNNGVYTQDGSFI